MDTGDAGWLWKGLGALGTASLIAYGELRLRLNRVEDKMQDAMDKDNDSNKASQNKLWDALEKHRKDFNDLQKHVYQNTATRADVKEAQASILEAIRKEVKA